MYLCVHLLGAPFVGLMYWKIRALPPLTPVVLSPSQSLGAPMTIVDGMSVGIPPTIQLAMGLDRMSTVYPKRSPVWPLSHSFKLKQATGSVGAIRFGNW